MKENSEIDGDSAAASMPHEQPPTFLVRKADPRHDVSLLS